MNLKVNVKVDTKKMIKDGVKYVRNNFNFTGICKEGDKELMKWCMDNLNNYTTLNFRRE